MKPIITLCDVHDASFCVYDIENDNLINIDFEKITRTKHFAFKRHVLVEKQIAMVRRALNYLEIHYGIKNDFSFCIFKTSKDVKLPLKEIINAEQYNISSAVCHHHKSHVLSSYGQSPFENAFAISWDGIGDDTSFYTAEVYDAVVTNDKKYVYDLSRTYNFVGRKLELLHDTKSWMDVAGKLMGLSSYGKHQDNSDELIEKLLKSSRYGLSKEEIDREPENVNSLRVSQYSDEYTGSSNLSWNNQWRDEIFEEIFPEEIIEDLELQYHYAYCAQKMIEKSIIELIENKFYDDIVKCDNNLILTGGVALNVIANQLIRKKFPEFNVYVSPCSNDAGHGFGLMYHFLTKFGYIDSKKKFDISYGGMRCYDDWIFKRLRVFYPLETITAKEVADLITEGKIVGVIQGRHEIGPRALGNRSIICDPSFYEMKDYLNSSVKFREWYRPFAPICRKEDAHKYFDSPTYEGYELMNFVADIKPEYADVFPSIVHVDGTCRLQTVTEEKNKFIYDLLGYSSGVLLNTSLNIKGQPILNTMTDAFDMLRDTGLDCFIYEHDGEFYYFDELVLSEYRV